MDYEEEEQYEEMQAEPQAEAIEIDAENAPYLDLRDDRERKRLRHPQEPKLRPHPSIRSGPPHQNRYVRRLL